MSDPIVPTITPAENAVVTWEKVKLMLSLSDEDEEYVEELIGRASATMETKVGGYIKQRERTFYLDGTGRQKLIVPDYPLGESVAVFVDSSRVFEEETEETLGVMYPEEGMIFLETGWPAGARNIMVVADVGYDPIPLDLEDACTKIVAANWSAYRGKRLGIKASTGMDGQRLEFEVGIPLDAHRVLESYRKAAV
jgi:hypothetical protein